MNYQNYDLNDRYLKQKKIEYRDVLLGSVLELSFVLQIEDEFSWIHEQKTIHYNPKTFEPTIYLTKNTGKYTPDFLIRNHKENTAFIVEIKPVKFLNSRQMQIRKMVVENYISENNLDFKYWIFSEKDIMLNHEKSLKRKKIINRNIGLNKKLRHYAKDDKFATSPQNRFSSIPKFESIDICPKEYRRYVRYGIIPEDKWW